MGPDQVVWALRITASDRYSDRCWSWGEPLDIALEGAANRPAGAGPVQGRQTSSVRLDRYPFA